MGWRFRKSFKILPGVRINIGKKGLTSTTIGKRGLTTSVGKKGIFQNIGIPGTGLSYRGKIPEVSRPVLIGGLTVVAAVVISICIIMLITK